MNRKTRILSALVAACMLLTLMAGMGTAMASAEARPQLTLFVDETWWQYDSWKGAIPELFSERINASIEVTAAADANQLPLMIASGDLPDIVCSKNFTRMSDSNVSYSLDELHEMYPDIEFPVHSVSQFVNTASDGHYYTINCHYSPDSVWETYQNAILSEGGGLVLNQTVFESLGIPEIKSFDDLEVAFQAAHDQDPERITIVFSPVHKFKWVMYQMGLCNDGYADQDGSLVWYLNQNGMLDYYKTINRWYRNGYLPSGVFAFKTEAEEMELSIAGRTFADFGYDNFADVYNAKITANGDSHKMMQFSEIIGEDAKFYNRSAGARGLYITKSCKDVEAAYRFLAHAYSDEGSKLLMWGVEGEDYTLDASGVPVFNYDREDTDTMRLRGLKYWGWICADAHVISLGATGETLNARKMLTSITEVNPVIGMVRFNADSDEATIRTKLEDMIKSQEVLIYMAESEAACEMAYNDMIKLAEQIGMSNLEEAANAQYKTLLEAYDQIRANKE